jgi:DNA invertase Pin-like site-specific DNA recombinase
MTEAIGYVRVSTREQAESGLSIDAQIRRIKQFCEFKELTLKEIIRDENVSAGIPLGEREGGSRLLALTQNKPYAVVAIKLDRLFRDAHDCLGVTKEWKAQGNSLMLMDLGVDTSTAMGRAFLTNAATYAELEKNLISERTKEALNQVKIQGGTLGASAFGWERSEEVDEFGRKKLVPNTEELKTVYECQALREAGYSLQQIADKFNNESRPTKRGGRWFPSTVRNYCKKKR